MEVIMVVPEDGTANFDSFVSAGLQQPGLKIPGANTGEFAVAFKIVTGGEYNGTVKLDQGLKKESEHGIIQENLHKGLQFFCRYRLAFCIKRGCMQKTGGTL